MYFIGICGGRGDQLGKRSHNSKERMKISWVYVCRLDGSFAERFQRRRITPVGAPVHGAALDLCQKAQMLSGRGQGEGTEEPYKARACPGEGLYFYSSQALWLTD